MSVDWHDDPDVVVHSQLAIAVYENKRQQVCIAQEGQYGDDEVYITVAKDNALALAQAIARVAGVDLTAKESPAPKDRTAAERQRRYRARNTVTPRHPVTDGENVLPLMAAE